MSQTQTRRSSQVDLLHGPILKSLLLFALPIMASRVFQQIYNTMDTLIVGYTLGDSSIAAMGACSSIYEMMTGFTFGVGNGLAIVTAVMQEKSGLNLVDFATGVMSFSYAGMLGVFLCALFTGRGNTRSVVAALVVGLLVVLLLQPYVLGPLSEWLVGRRINIAWPWWCPIGGVVSFAVCCLGKKKNEK